MDFVRFHVSFPYKLCSVDIHKLLLYLISGNQVTCNGVSCEICVYFISCSTSLYRHSRAQMLKHKPLYKTKNVKSQMYVNDRHKKHQHTLSSSPQKV